MNFYFLHTFHFKKYKSVLRDIDRNCASSSSRPDNCAFKKMWLVGFTFTLIQILPLSMAKLISEACPPLFLDFLDLQRLTSVSAAELNLRL